MCPTIIAPSLLGATLLDVILQGAHALTRRCKCKPSHTLALRAIISHLLSDTGLARAPTHLVGRHADVVHEAVDHLQPVHPLAGAALKVHRKHLALTLCARMHQQEQLC